MPYLDNYWYGESRTCRTGCYAYEEYTKVDNDHFQVRSALSCSRSLQRLIMVTFRSDQPCHVAGVYKGWSCPLYDHLLVRSALSWIYIWVNKGWQWLICVRPVFECNRDTKTDNSHCRWIKHWFNFKKVHYSFSQPVWLFFLMY